MLEIVSGFQSISAPAPDGLQSVSDDECVARLSQAIDRHDDSKLDEVAALIGRLAVPIEL